MSWYKMAANIRPGVEINPEDISLEELINKIEKALTNMMAPFGGFDYRIINGDRYWVVGLDGRNIIEVDTKNKKVVCSHPYLDSTNTAHWVSDRILMESERLKREKRQEIDNKKQKEIEKEQKESDKQLEKSPEWQEYKQLLGKNVNMSWYKKAKVIDVSKNEELVEPIICVICKRWATQDNGKITWKFYNEMSEEEKAEINKMQSVSTYGGVRYKTDLCPNCEKRIRK